jgi:hypothetical protein
MPRQQRLWLLLRCKIKVLEDFSGIGPARPPGQFLENRPRSGLIPPPCLCKRKPGGAIDLPVVPARPGLTFSSPTGLEICAIISAKPAAATAVPLE